MDSFTVINIPVNSNLFYNVLQLVSSTFTELAEVLKAYGEGLDAYQLEGQLLLLPQVAVSMEFDTPRINIDELTSFFQSIDDSHVASV